LTGQRQLGSCCCAAAALLLLRSAAAAVAEMQASRISTPTDNRKNKP
jgi:hypothetical protein